MRVRIVLGVLAALVLGWSGSASAEKKRVGVPRFDGPQEAIVRKAVMQVLKGQGFDVVGAKEIDGAAKGTGVQLDSNDGFKAVAKELSISAYVTGEVSKKKAKLTVRNGADGFVSGEGAFGGPNPNKIAADVRDGFSRRLGSAVDRGRAPSGAKKPAAAPVAEADDADEGAAAGGDDEKASSNASNASNASSNSTARSERDETPPDSASSPDETLARKAPSAPEGDSGPVGPRALDLAVGFGGFSRNLSYNQAISALRAYKLTLGPAAVFSAVIYPAAFVKSGFVANLGAEVNIEQAFGVTSSVPGSDPANPNPGNPFPTGANFNTVIHDLYGGVRARLVLSGGHEIALFAGGGEHAFSFRDGPNAADDRSKLTIPDTIYRYLRAGIDARFELPSGMTAGLSGAYRYVLNHAGQISEADFFPGLTVGGVDFNAMLGYHVTPSIEARFNVNLRRYFYAMNSIPGDTSIAGGAVDQYVGFAFGAAYVFGGAPPRSASSDEDPTTEPAPAPKKSKKSKKSGDEDEGDEGGADASEG